MNKCTQKFLSNHTGKCNPPTNILNFGYNSLDEIIDAYKIQNDIYKVNVLSSIGDCVFGAHNDNYTNREAIIPSKRNNHQCRLKTDDLLNFIHTLETKEPYLPHNDFDTLWIAICKLNCKGIGPVTCYDTALRYSLLHKLPEPQYVYLHSTHGPLKGAKAYFAIKKITEVSTPDGKIKVNSLKSGCRIDISFFTDFSAKDLDCKHIENLLCIYHNELCKILSLRISI